MPNSSASKQHPSKFLARDSIPIIFGVTGHRDIPQSDVSILHEAVQEYFKKVVEQYPNSQVILLSALAEGADRISARAAMEAGCSLGVFLPFKQLVRQHHNAIQQIIFKNVFSYFTFTTQRIAIT